MANNFLFYYFGDDDAYFRSLGHEFRKNTNMVIDFKKAYEVDEKKIQTFFIEVYNKKPACVFVDFSKNTKDYLHLARIISRIPIDYQLVTVGLVDYLSPPLVIAESNATGVTLTHIKSAEFYDVVFDVAYLVSPGAIAQHEYANAKLKDVIEAGYPAKVGFIHNEGLHIETDYNLKKGDKISINHFWSLNKIIPSREVVVQEVANKNLFYHFKHAVDLNFMVVDEYFPPEGTEASVIEEKKKSREDLVFFYKKLLGKWIIDNETRSLEKKSKILVIDKDFHFYNNQPRTDRHGYTIRCLPLLTDINSELDRFEPQVIAYAFEPNSQLDIKLFQLMKVLKERYKENPPFVVVFNCKTPTKEFQQSFSYWHIITTDAELSVDVLVKMADMFNKKFSLQVAAEPSMYEKAQKVYLDKSNPASLIEIVIPITIIKISETDMVFTSEREIPIGANLHLTSPADMYINVQPTKPSGKLPEYHGLIHCLGEEEKQELRRFVNSVFFRDHTERKVAEKAEFDKLNALKLQEKQDLLQKQAEAKEAEKAAESEAKKTP